MIDTLKNVGSVNLHDIDSLLNGIYHIFISLFKSKLNYKIGLSEVKIAI
jgi:RimJ/RimL family protein N-acetyltransferase